MADNTKKTTKLPNGFEEKKKRDELRLKRIREEEQKRQEEEQRRATERELALEMFKADLIDMIDEKMRSDKEETRFPISLKEGYGKCVISTIIDSYESEVFHDFAKVGYFVYFNDLYLEPPGCEVLIGQKRRN